MTSYDQLTTREVARKLGITPRGVQAMVARGKITPDRKLEGVRGAYLFARKDVERLAKKRAS